MFSFADGLPFIDNRADVVNNIGDIYQKQPIPISSLVFDSSKSFTIENVVLISTTSASSIGTLSFVAIKPIIYAIKTGDTFVTNHAQKKTWSIQEIVSKYVGLFRNIVPIAPECFIP
jgi:hypothetical protein